MTAPPIRREDLISRKAAAALLKIHPNTLDREARAVGLKKHRIVGDNQVFYLRAEIGRIEIVQVVDGDA